MAATVEAAVKWIGNQVVEEAKYLYGVDEKVEELYDELRWMTCFLRDVDANRDRDERMREWINQIMWLAYQAEDIVDTFILKVGWQRGGDGGILDTVKRYSCLLVEAKARHQARSEIDSLMLKISKLTSRLQTYGVKIAKEGSSSTVRREIQLRKSWAHLVQDETKTVGLDDDMKRVVDQLRNENSSRTVALWGMGGSGKTTLAKKVYHHRDVRKHFNAFAWAYISEQCQAKPVLMELLRGLTLENVSDDRTIEDLTDNLYKLQQEKKCLIVLDDIWKDDAWGSLKNAFPVGRTNSQGGKLMLTTRNETVAVHIDKKAFIHKQRRMNDNEARQLLESKLERELSSIFGEHNDKMEELTSGMLKQCGGLPLAIVTLGGVLARKQSLDEWKTVHDNIDSFLSKVEDEDLSFKEVLELSYYDLPVYLKPCFLYLGTFPEDAEISARKLIQLWMAEGFISTSTSSSDDYGDAINVQASMEIVGQRYLTELVDRSLVQVGLTGKNGKIKTCRVHDLLRDLCITKAEEENFLKVVVGGRHSTPSTSQAYTRRIRYRRLSIHDELGWKKIADSSRQKDIDNASHIKSLLIHHRAKTPDLEREIVTQFRMLRVLDLKGSDMTALPKEVGGLVHLRYLSIRDSKIKAVPSSIGNLRCLRTLDLESSFIVWFPDVIWRMRELRHVYLPTKYRARASKKARIRCNSASNLPPEGLNNLEILSNYHEFDRLKYLAELTNLRVLSNVSSNFIMGKEEVRHIKNFKTRRLEYLSIKMNGDATTEVADLHNFPHLSTLKLRIDGGRTLLDVLPQNVTSLSFECTYLNTDAMQILEKLANLRSLTLDTYSYEGNKMICSKGGFPKLTYLYISELEYLEQWTIEKEAMPNLGRLFIRRCTKMKRMPSGLMYIGSLQRLKIFGMPQSFCDGVREWKVNVEREGGDEGATRQLEGPDSDKLRHIPIIDIQQQLYEARNTGRINM